MNARYYVAVVEKASARVPLPPGGPFADRDAATASAVRVIGSSRPGVWDPEARYEHRFLLDTGSVDADDIEAVRHLVLTDPLLHAVFKLGEQHGYHQGREDAG